MPGIGRIAMAGLLPLSHIQQSECSKPRKSVSAREISDYNSLGFPKARPSTQARRSS
jgi:hypothetical protein